MGMNKDQVEGRMKEATGKMQEVAGRVIGNRTEEAKGMMKKHVGTAQSKLGDLKEDLRKRDR